MVAKGRGLVYENGALGLSILFNTFSKQVSEGKLLVLCGSAIELKDLLTQQIPTNFHTQGYGSIHAQNESLTRIHRKERLLDWPFTRLLL